jgi:hypothetical protein
VVGGGVSDVHGALEDRDGDGWWRLLYLPSLISSVVDVVNCGSYMKFLLFPR